MKDYKFLLDYEIVDKANKIVRSVNKNKHNFSNLNKAEKEEVLNEIKQKLNMNKEQALWILDVRNHNKAIKKELLKIEGIEDERNCYTYQAFANHVKKSQVINIIFTLIFLVIGLLFVILATSMEDSDGKVYCYSIGMFILFLSIVSILSHIKEFLIFRKNHLESINTDTKVIANTKPIGVSFATINHLTSFFIRSFHLISEIYAIIFSVEVNGKTEYLYYFTQVIVHHDRYNRSVFRMNSQKFIRNLLLEENLRFAYYPKSKFIDFEYGNIQDKIDAIVAELENKEYSERFN